MFENVDKLQLQQHKQFECELRARQDAGGVISGVRYCACVLGEVHINY